jgi:hypothetical protein
MCNGSLFGVKNLQFELLALRVWGSTIKPFTFSCGGPTNLSLCTPVSRKLFDVQRSALVRPLLSVYERQSRALKAQYSLAGWTVSPARSLHDLPS